MGRPSLDPAVKRQTDILTQPSDTVSLFTIRTSQTTPISITTNSNSNSNKIANGRSSNRDRSSKPGKHDGGTGRDQGVNDNNDTNNFVGRTAFRSSLHHTIHHRHHNTEAERTDRQPPALCLVLLSIGHMLRTYGYAS
ncbi:hypothetical protein CTA1_6981 [Colletotrichum tanaceti]|uniref:Uncharacterized protein n=1 Tax=Colletotrichum tanaceti TaxID=1306861 RepID=A0A4U6XI30_9PEZI|nr:hypothetical protein CTA1_6981 [Colletotrichum tanaceti]